MSEEHDQLVRIALGMYADEPCRICGKNLTLSDIYNGAVFVGYSQDKTSRSAHEECWKNQPPAEEWAKP